MNSEAAVREAAARASGRVGVGSKLGVESRERAKGGEERRRKRESKEEGERRQEREGVRRIGSEGEGERMESGCRRRVLQMVVDRKVEVVCRHGVQKSSRKRERKNLKKKLEK